MEVTLVENIVIVGVLRLQRGISNGESRRSRRIIHGCCRGQEGGIWTRESSRIDQTESGVVAAVEADARRNARQVAYIGSAALKRQGVERGIKADRVVLSSLNA